jgi:hypothetical protein
MITDVIHDLRVQCRVGPIEEFETQGDTSALGVKFVHQKANSYCYYRDERHYIKNMATHTRHLRINKSHR